MPGRSVGYALRGAGQAGVFGVPAPPGVQSPGQALGLLHAPPQAPPLPVGPLGTPPVVPPDRGDRETRKKTPSLAKRRPPCCSHRYGLGALCYLYLGSKMPRQGQHTLAGALPDPLPTAKARRPIVNAAASCTDSASCTWYLTEPMTDVKAGSTSIVTTPSLAA